MRGAEEKGIDLVKANDFQSVTGKGVTGQVDGHAVAAGNVKLLESLGISVGDLSQQADKQRAEGQTVMLIAIDGKAAGLIGVADPIKDSTAEAIRDLHAEGIRIVMLTGDSHVTAKAVAGKLGIDQVHAEVLPEQKAELIKQLQAEGRIVAMAGDGINDAPALAQAQVGIAMGTGTDVAIESAGITLVKGDLRGIVRARRLSRATMRNIRQNLFFAFIYNTAGVPDCRGRPVSILRDTLIAHDRRRGHELQLGFGDRQFAQTQEGDLMRCLARDTAVAALVFLMFSAPPLLQGATVEYDLTIARQAVNITGKPAEGMTINGVSPGPTLRFREGDLARIRVHNRMDEDTSIHWHGILVPPGMDGVPYLSFPPIRPGETFTYEFPIRQRGTYWYHSHTHLQEQSGVYGSIVIEPLQGGPKPDRDHVVVLSDWTDEDPRTVNRTLKRGSHWYAFEKGSAQSILGAARLGMLGDYFLRELQRMPAMDIADVAYDRFLANGKPDSTLPAGPQEKVLLRVINSSSSSYFHLEFAGGPMTIVAADGQDVEPIQERRLLVGVAETYDLLVQIPAAGAYEFRATAHDGSGYASVWLGSGERHPAPEVPRPNLYHGMGHLGLQQIFSLTPAGTMGMPDGDVDAGRFDRPGMAGMGSMEMDHSGHAAPAPASPAGGMDHGGHTMPMPAPPPEGMDHSGHATPSAPPAETVDHDGHTLAAPVSSPETMDHGAHDLPTAPEGPRSGKRYGTHFGFLAADVSASEEPGR